MVEWVWTVYAPGGQLLSKQEQNEAHEEFEKWRRTGRYWEQKIGGVAKATNKKLHPARPVSFLEFRAWFLRLTTYLEHLRGAVVCGDNQPTAPSFSEEKERYISLDLN